VDDTDSEQATHAITWGQNKDHRPDLKQLYTLMVNHDGGVPVYFTNHSGNVVDDKTHCATRDLDLPDVLLMVWLAPVTRRRRYGKFVVRCNHEI